MVVTIPDLLNSTQLEALCSVLRQGKFVDGKLSAGDDARHLKNNLELGADAERYSALNNVVMTALVQHPEYLQTAMPAKIAAPYLCPLPRRHGIWRSHRRSDHGGSRCALSL